MSSINNVTGDAIESKLSSAEACSRYAEGWDAIWGKKPKKLTKQQIQKQIDDMMDQVDSLGRQTDVLLAEIEKFEKLL